MVGRSHGPSNTRWRRRAPIGACPGPRKVDTERQPEIPEKLGTSAKKTSNKRQQVVQHAEQNVGYEEVSPCFADHHSDHSTAPAATSEEALESSAASSRGDEDHDLHPLCEEEGHELGKNLLCMLRSSAPTSASRRGSGQPITLSTDEYQLRRMEEREDKECGADEFNAETFGKDAGDGWSFEENLEANLQLECPRAAKAWRGEGPRAFSQTWGLGWGAAADVGQPHGAQRQPWVDHENTTTKKFAAVMEAMKRKMQVYPVELVKVFGPGSEGWVPGAHPHDWTLTLFLKQRKGFEADARRVAALAQDALFVSAADTMLGWEHLGLSAGVDEQEPMVGFSVVLFDEGMQWTSVGVEITRPSRCGSSRRLPPGRHQDHQEVANYYTGLSSIQFQ